MEESSLMCYNMGCWSMLILVLTHIYIYMFVYPFLFHWTDCFHFLAILNNAAMNMGVQIMFLSRNKMFKNCLED